MRIITLIISTIMVLSFLITNPINTQTNTIFKFTIFTYQTTMERNVDGKHESKILVFDKPIQILKLDENGLAITKIDRIIDKDNYVYMAPVLNKDGNPKIIDPSNKTEIYFSSNKLLRNSMSMRAFGYDKHFIISQIEFDGFAVHTVNYTSFDPDGRQGWYNLDSNQMDTKLSKFYKNNMCSFFIIDEDFNYQVEYYDGQSFQHKECKTINIDNMNADEESEIIGLNNILTETHSDYSFWANNGLGFLELKMSDNDNKPYYCSGGRKRYLPFAVLENIDGILTVNAELVINQLGGVSNWEKGSGNYTLQKLVYKDLGQSELVKMKFSLTSKEAFVNELNVQLVLAPYKTMQYYPMIAIDDLAKYFGISYHFRPLDGTMLIEKFHAFDRID